jgi:hypothetical protein
VQDAFDAYQGTGLPFASSSSREYQHAQTADCADLATHHPVGIYQPTPSAAAAAAGSTFPGAFPQVQSAGGRFPWQTAAAPPSTYNCSFYKAPPAAAAAAAGAAGGLTWPSAAVAPFMPPGADPSSSFSYSDSTFVPNGFSGNPYQDGTAAYPDLAYGLGSTAAQYQEPWGHAGFDPGYPESLLLQGGTPGLQGYPCTQLPSQGYGQQQSAGQRSSSSLAALGHSASFSGLAAASLHGSEAAPAVHTPAVVVDWGAAWGAGVQCGVPVLAVHVSGSAPVSPSAAAAGTSSSEAAACTGVKQQRGTQQQRQNQKQQGPQSTAAAPPKAASASAAGEAAVRSAAAAKGRKLQAGGVWKASAAARPVPISKASKRKMRDAQELNDKQATEDKVGNTVYLNTKHSMYWGRRPDSPSCQYESINSDTRILWGV